jgi:hypothetical protein
LLNVARSNRSFDSRKIEFRLITAFIAVVLISVAIAEGARAPVRWMKTLLLRYSSAPSNTTKSMKSESHWIASRTAPKRRRTLILNSFSAKFTTPNVAAILKQVVRVIVTAFIAIPAKSSTAKQPKTNGSRIGRRQTKCRKDFVRTQVALAEASAIMISRR